MTAKFRRGRRSARVAASAAASTLLLSYASASGETAGVEQVSVEELKANYLACEASASLGRLVGGDAMYCSIIYEELKERAFEGDFQQIRNWLDTHSDPAGTMSGGGHEHSRKRVRA